MSWWGRFKHSVAQRAISWADFPQASFIYEGTSAVAAGIAVTERTALMNSAFWCGVNMIASQIATLPRNVYRRLEDDQRERDRTQPASRVLTNPNPNMTDVVFWELLVAHALTWGNGYAEIEWDGAYRPVGLWPIAPDRVNTCAEYTTTSWRKVHKINNGRVPVLDDEDVIQIPGLGYDGIKGYSVVAMARQSLGLGMAAERFGGKFFGNGARPQTILRHPGTLSKDAQDRLRESIKREHGGENQLGVMVAEEGMKVETIGVPPDDAQFLETRQFQVEEIARWLNINPAKLKLKVGERPGGNLETSQIEFLTDCLRPWLVRIEQELDRKLFPVSQRQTFYVEHNVEALLRMDTTTRMQSYKALQDMGVVDAEWIAKKESLPPPPEQPEPAPAPMPSPTSDTPVPPPPADGRMASAQRALIVEAVARFVRKEADRIRKAAKEPEGFGKWLEEFYDSERQVLRGYLLGPARLSLAAAGVDGDPAKIAEVIAENYVRQSMDELESLPQRGLEAAADKLVTQWESSRPVTTADLMIAMDLSKTNRVALSA